MGGVAGLEHDFRLRSHLGLQVGQCLLRRPAQLGAPGVVGVVGSLRDGGRDV